jgi:hypothetical protein
MTRASERCEVRSRLNHAGVELLLNPVSSHDPCYGFRIST